MGNYYVISLAHIRLALNVFLNERKLGTRLMTGILRILFVANSTFSSFVLSDLTIYTNHPIELTSYFEEVLYAFCLPKMQRKTEY